MALIPESKIEEVRSAVNIVHYIQQFVNLKKAGANYKGLCPFHTEKTPSFMVSPQKQIYRCFGCGKGGNIFTFIKEYEKLPFMEALEKAADFAGVALPKPEPEDLEKVTYFQQLYHINEVALDFFEKSLWMGQNKVYLQYFLKRSISEQTIRKFHLGFAPDSYDKLLPVLKKAGCSLEEAEKLGLIRKREKSSGYYDKFRYRVMFPFHNTSGKIIGFGGRQLDPEHQPKYLNSPESPIYKKGELLYGLHQAIQAIREQDRVILVEGYFDLLRLVESGIGYVVASSGTAFTESQARLLRRYTKNVHIAYDGDSAGRKAAIRSAAILEKEGLTCFIVRLPDGEDPDTYVLQEGPAVFEKLLERRVNPIQFRIDDFFARIPNPTVEEKESLIQEVLNQLAQFPDTVKSGLYLHELSDMLQINESLLVDQLNRYKRFQRKNKDDVKPAPVRLQVQSGMYKAETGILGLLLNGAPEIRNLILNEVHTEQFTNEELRNLFMVIIDQLEDAGELDLGQLMDHYQDDDEMLRLLSAISMEEFGLEQRYALDCIFQLKKFYLEQKSRDISELIKQEADSPESLELHYQNLMAIKKELNTLIKEHRGR